MSGRLISHPCDKYLDVRGLNFKHVKVKLSSTAGCLAH